MGFPSVVLVLMCVSVAIVAQGLQGGPSCTGSLLHRVAGELQALRTAMEQAARDIVPAGRTAMEQATRDPASANDRQATPENRLESIEKVTKDKIAGEPQALETAGPQAARGSRRQAGLESIEKLTKEKIAGEPQALETAGQQAAAGQQAGSSGRSVYEIDDRTKVQCTRAVPKIHGDCWTRF